MEVLLLRDLGGSRWECLTKPGRKTQPGTELSFGDGLLRVVAQRLLGRTRRSDLVARLGGDEFAVLLAPLHKAEDAQRIADKIIASMDMPIPLPGDTQVLTSLSIGIAIYPEHGATPGTLLNAADAAMYQAKRLSSGGQQTAESEHSVANVQHRS